MSRCSGLLQRYAKALVLAKLARSRIPDLHDIWASFPSFLYDPAHTFLAFDKISRGHNELLWFHFEELLSFSS